MTQAKPDHHELPKYYLAGFCAPEQNGLPFVWAFSKGSEFTPGKKFGNNPRCQSTSKTALRPDGYKTAEADGRWHYDYEEELQKEEKKCDEIFLKIRSGHAINETDKEKLNLYIWLTFRRVTHHDSAIVAELEKQSAKRDVPFIVKRLTYAGRFSEARRLMDYYQFLLSSKGRTKLIREYMMKDYEHVSAELLGMRWEFVYAESPNYFVTSDNPVIFDRSAGLRSSPFFFPIGYNAILQATHEQGNDLAIRVASVDEIHKINSIIISQAKELVISPYPEKWIFDGFNSGFSILPPS